MTNTERLRVVENLTHFITERMDLRQQLEIIKVIDPTRTMSPTDSDFIIGKNITLYLRRMCSCVLCLHCKCFQDLELFSGYSSLFNLYLGPIQIIWGQIYPLTLHGMSWIILFSTLWPCFTHGWRYIYRLRITSNNNNKIDMMRYNFRWNLSTKIKIM